MGIEIERKFLVKPEASQDIKRPGVIITQGYLSIGQPVCYDLPIVRIRKTSFGMYSSARIGIKSKGTIERLEYEYDIPVPEAEALLKMTPFIITKVRYNIEFEEMNWEYDVFKESLEGLHIAEVELTDKDQEVILPPWIIKEVTEDSRYSNVNLIVNGLPC